ncbi:hypothetical protein FRC03_008684 [Tulasnella sp. 419]|nr:hypothetical protein FRC03_008684 [Tulasnella sp. 419]
MPPIPPNQLLEEAQAIRSGIYRRIKDLREYQLPRIRDCTGPLSLQQQFAGELREDIEFLATQTKALETLADDQETEKDRAKVLDWVEETNELIDQIRKDARAALLASKKKIDAFNKSYRDELLSPGVHATSSTPSEKGSLSGEDALMRANNDVTEALRRTTALMQQELERSVLTAQMFDESSRTLQSTSDLYTQFGTLMHTSKTLVTALERADNLDRMLIISALVLFLAVVAYILKKRVIDKGLWLAFWWVKYLPWPKEAADTGTTV